MKKHNKPESRRRLKSTVTLLLVCVLMFTAIVSGVLSSTAYAADTTILLGSSGASELLPGEPTWYNSIEDQYGTLWVADTQVDIFKISYENDRQEVTVAGRDSSKVIAPGTENSYSFAVKNTAGGFLDYKVITQAWFAGLDGSGKAIPVQVKMQGLDWFVGGESEWRPVMELNGAEESGSVEPGKHVLYTLQWQWPFEQDLNGDGNIDDGDELDTWLASQGEVSLTIKMNVLYSYAFPESPGINAPIPDYFDSDKHLAYLYGFPDGSIRPESAITRAETAAVFYRLLKDSIREQYRTDSCRYSDVAEEAWYITEVATLSAMGILEGYPDGTFQPNDPISRAEMACLLARFSGEEYSGKGKTEFSDIEGHWAENEIMLVEDFRWIEGYPDATFAPGNNISRAETAAMVNRMLHRLPEKLGDLLPGMRKWPDNADEEAWYYIAIQEASNSHDYQRLLGTREKWTAILEVIEIYSN